MKRFYILGALFLWTSMTFGQQNVQYLLQERLNQSAISEVVKPFKIKKGIAKSNYVNTAVLDNFQVLDLDQEIISNLITSKPEVMGLSIPLSDVEIVDLELIRVDITTAEFNVFEASNQSRPFNHVKGDHYWGRIKGDATSLAAISIFGNEITGTINYKNQSLSLVKLQSSSEHILYQEKDLKDKPTFACFADDVESVAKANKPSNAKVGEDNVVRMYIEVDNDIYQDFGTTEATTNYIMAVLNQVAIMYANDNINFAVNEMLIWDTTDPYTGPSSGNFLTQFRNQLNGEFNGDLAHLLGNSGGGGVAYVDVLCTDGTAGVAYSGINNTFENVPVYSWTVMVITHEIGHNLGSPHTHACAWNGNNTAIDGCGPAAGYGGCNGPIPAEGGTVMSYCHLNPVGINLSLGFGPQPGDLVRSRVYEAPCLTADPSSCEDGVQNGLETGVDCGGPACPVCPPTCDDGIQNGEETGVDCGGPDCLACPTCDDGIQNGNETDVDCGGDCSPCPTCDDGIQNGDETGVDCGGPNCPACPACDDGVQNGNETGVDCGGSDCPACPTCDDGIQNGDETGVDCGGTCAACGPCGNDYKMDITLNFDDYPEETTWEIRTDAGILVHSGGPYGSQQDGSTLVISQCMPQGCYEFTIFDAFGDGICCGFGNGSYTVTIAGEILASGGSFQSSETTAFCLGETQNPTCDDGIQNGNETGVDCGGLDCPACPTCDDGVQNGGETGIDCGGICEPCTDPPACNDGIQNGDETGVDCGGSACPACPTCNDGIQNGNETGIDCGGPDCPPCNSGCTDVIITLNFDDYPEETTWNISNSSGQIVANGGPYGSQADGSTLVIPECLDEGCYDFTILDAFGDGICCGFGQGSYSVTINGFIVASGGSFDSSETTNICIGDDPGPNCNDGIQNGNETGVDCGGPDCTPCNEPPTCDDGIQNGNETDVDCGGSDCPPCADPPTCDDGIQNGDEMGIDCGGADCPPCGGCTFTIISSTDFESGFNGWIDGGSDCRRSSLDSEFANSGIYCVRLRDNSSSSILTSQNFNLASVTDVRIDFSFIAGSMDNSNEDFWLQVSTNGGSSYTTVEEWNEGDEFENDIRVQTSVELSMAFTSNTRFRFRCDASTNSDLVYIDDVVISACQTGALPQTSSLEPASPRKIITENLINVVLYPNPTIDEVNVDYTINTPQIVQLMLYDLTGKLVKSERLNQSIGRQTYTIQTDQFNEGLYHLMIIGKEDRVVKKFIVARR